MTTISIPLTPEHEKMMENLLEKGYGSNKSDLMRKALQFLADEEAVQEVLRAEQEPILKGDIRELMKKLR